MLRSTAAAAAALLSINGCGFPDDGQTVNPEVAARRAGEAGLAISLAWDGERYTQGRPLWLTWKLSNASNADVWVISHHETPQARHFDNLHLTVTSARDESVRRVEFVGPRKATARVGCLLEPGQALLHRLDLTAWLGFDLEAGSYEMSATYSVPRDERPLAQWGRVDHLGQCSQAAPSLVHGAPRPVWTGEVTSSAISLEVESQ